MLFSLQIRYNGIMANIKAVIYDVDGTLINTEPLHVKAWDEALTEYGSSLDSLSSEFLQTMAGKKPAIIAEGMTKELGLDTTSSELLANKTKKFLALVEVSLQAMPGAIESVKRFKAMGYALGIGTSLDRSFINSVLDKLGLQNEFDAIVTGDEITRGKPDPETYLLVAMRLGIDSAECLVFEDARTGVESAKASGAFCIAVENKAAAPQKLDNADLVIGSFNELSDDLIASL